MRVSLSDNFNSLLPYFHALSSTNSILFLFFSHTRTHIYIPHSIARLFNKLHACNATRSIIEHLLLSSEFVLGEKLEQFTLSIHASPHFYIKPGNPIEFYSHMHIHTHHHTRHRGMAQAHVCSFDDLISLNQASVDDKVGLFIISFVRFGNNSLMGSLLLDIPRISPALM